MKAGETFNPHRQLIQINIPISLIGSGLSWFDLVLYGRLQLHKAKDADSCFVGLTTLASEMAVSIASVKRGLTDLIDAGLIERKRGGRGHENVYTFLWADVLTGSLRSRMATDDSSGVSHQRMDDSSNLNHMMAQFCTHDGSILSRPYKEEKIPEKIPEKNNSRSSAMSKRESAIDVWFSETFWPIFPRKVGRAAALRIAAKVAKTPEDREAIMSGLERHLPELQSREQRFVPHASTWLSQRRWEDEPEAPRPTRPLNAVEALYL